MKLVDIAAEFADLNIFNSSTRKTLLEKVSVFCRRSNVHYVADLSLASISHFKQQTLSLAQPITYNGYIRYMRLVLDHAVNMKYTDNNPFRSIRLAPVGEVSHKVLELDTLDEVCDFLVRNANRYKPAWFWITVIYTLYNTGMRRRQLVSLKLKDIDFNKRLIRLSYEGSKTRRSWSIPIDADLCSHLQELVLRSEMVMGRRMLQSDYLFVVSRFYSRYKTNSDGGTPPEAITGFFKRLSRGFGGRIGAHRFRHTLATELCNPGDDSPPDIFSVQSILGHTSIQTTRRYVQTNTNQMRNTLARLHKPFSRKYHTELTF